MFVKDISRIKINCDGEAMVMLMQSRSPCVSDQSSLMISPVDSEVVVFVSPTSKVPESHALEVIVESGKNRFIESVAVLELLPE